MVVVEPRDLRQAITHVRLCCVPIPRRSAKARAVPEIRSARTKKRTSSIGQIGGKAKR
jgi:hypothetical protein